MILTTHDVAQALGTDLKTTRRFLRAVVPNHDPSQRWEIAQDDLDKLRLVYLVRRLGEAKALEILQQYTSPSAAA